jgi:histone H3/H4
VVAAASPAPGDRGEPTESEASEAEVLIVVSKLKKYVRDRSGMNTSDGVVAVLSDHVRELCREAIRQAGQESRRTVLDRDFTKVLESFTGGNREGNFRSRR